MKIISERNVLPAIAYWGCAQDPFCFPRNLEVVIRKARQKIRTMANKDIPDFFYVEIQEEEIEDWVKELLMDIPEFVDWNLSENEAKNGIKVDDENRGEYLFTSAYSSTPEDDDFIDLDACIRNIANMLMREDL
jgi:hypothetical protein